MGLCIYCLKDSSSSENRSHILPESFLQNGVTLEPGIECDECNNFAAGLEQAFVYHNRIWTQIMTLRVPGKNGKRRKRMAHYSADDKTEMLTIRYRPRWITEAAGEKRIFFPDPPEYSDAKFRRCLGHICLNYIAWKFGREVALENKFDELRRYVRYSRRTERWPYGQVSHDDSLPRRKLRLGLAPGAPGLSIRLESYIDDFYFDPLKTCELESWIARCNGQENLYHQGSLQ